MRWADLDGYGHVNNAVYLTYLEEARDRLLDAAFGAQAYDFVVAHVGVDFRREITQDDGEVTVESVITGWGRSSVRTAETITLRDGGLAAEAVTVLVARDAATGGSRPLTDAERVRLTDLWGPWRSA